MIYLEQQLKLLRFLQEHRGPWIEKILLVYNFFDTAIFVSLLVTFIWIGCSWKWGARLSFVIIFNGLINYLSKQAFALPRPEFFDASLPMVHVMGFGFPSGGAQNSVLLGGLLIYYARSPWIKLLGGLFAITVSFSRLYLGVHFPIDVLGGIFLGLLVLFSFIFLRGPTEKMISLHPNYAFLFSLVCSTPLFFFSAFNIHLLLLSLMTSSIGLFFSTRFNLYFSPPNRITKNLLLGSYGVLSSCFLAVLLSLLSLEKRDFLVLSNIVIGLWVSLGACPVGNLIFNKK